MCATKSISVILPRDHASPTQSISPYIHPSKLANMVKRVISKCLRECTYHACRSIPTSELECATASEEGHIAPFFVLLYVDSQWKSKHACFDYDMLPTCPIRRIIQLVTSAMLECDSLFTKDECYAVPVTLHAETSFSHSTFHWRSSSSAASHDLATWATRSLK